MQMARNALHGILPTYLSNWTSNLMAPEAYILHDALEGWISGETAQQIRVRAAKAYAKYQKISQRAAENLLVTGW